LLGDRECRRTHATALFQTDSERARWIRIAQRLSRRRWMLNDGVDAPDGIIVPQWWC
jgi:hypothetical protein